ncbi:thiamine phosphate synthase [Candidatus Poribacteria bacterium]|nr:MAG: thiamine phosphate synthase [Candidatus Poribacteria bacterium]
MGFRLYAITDRHRCAPTPLVDVISELLDAGVTAIQLREKDLNDTELMQLAQPIAELCRNYEAKLFINTNARVALEVEAAGIHLPANAEPVDTIKAQTDENLYVGCSVHSLDAAQKREAEGADFVTYSPIYRTASKPGYGPAVGVACLAEVAETVKLPVFALGGITPARVSECLAAGAFGVAVMSGIMSPKNAGKQAKRYLNFFNNALL